MSSLVRRILLLGLAVGILFDALVPGNAAGLNAPVVVTAFLVAALLVAGRDGIGRMDRADAWLGPAALVLASLATIRADDWLVTVDLLLAAALAAGTVVCLAGGRITRGLVPHVLERAVGAVAAAAVGAGTVLAAARPDPSAASGPTRLGRLRARLRRAAPVARGLVIAVPVVAVFVILFASADAVFARLTSNVLAWKPDLDLGDLAFRTVVVGVVAWTSAGLLGLASGLLPGYVPASPARGVAPVAAVTVAPVPVAPVPAPAGTAPSSVTTAGGSAAAASTASGPPPASGPSPSPCPPPAPPVPAAGPGPSGAVTWPTGPAGPAARPSERPALRLGTTEAATILVVVDLLFAAFVALQLAYLFGGRDTMAMAGLTYAEYARRGFFELVLVALLAGTLVVTLDLAAGSRSRTQLAGALALLALTAVVLVSALVRLRLYQDAYGWTELRFVVLVAIGWLGVALALAAGLLVARRTRWTLHALGILVIVTLVAMNAVGPQAFVTARNLERAIDPTLVPEGGRTGLDTGYLAELGDEAVVPIVAAWDRLGEADRAALAPALARRERQLGTDPSLQGWPAWNLTRQRARDALRAWEATGPAASR